MQINHFVKWNTIYFPQDFCRDVLSEFCTRTQIKLKYFAVVDPSVNMSSIHARAAEAMRDIGSDEDVSDTDDPDLLAELQVMYRQTRFRWSVE